MTAFGIDIGGSGIKGAPVDLSTGSIAADRARVPTPDPSTPPAVLEAVQQLVDADESNGAVGITIPGVVVSGVVRTASNIDKAWVSLDARRMFSESLARPVTVLNDADAAGVAEARFGAGKDVKGVVLLLTFGTGIGSALLVDGVLVPNTELGHLEFKGDIAEGYAAGRLVKRESKSIEWWARRVDELLTYIELLLSPNRIIIGGGISKRFEEFVGFLHTDAELVPAGLRNNAGIVGAAMAAEEDAS